MVNQPISRRALIRGSAAALLTAGLWPGMLAAQDAPVPDMDFLCINDLHYIDEGCVPFFKTVVDKMKEAAPNSKLLYVVGDLCDNGKPEQHAAIRDILKTVGATMKAVRGNHDWTTQTDCKAYEDAWPDSINYTFEHGGWQFVGLDSSDGVKYQETSILQPTLDWIDQNLPKLDKKRPMLICTHFPMGETVKYRPANADAVLDRFKEFNLRGVFNGHYHAYTQHKHGDFEITTNKCCSFRRNNHDGTPEKGFFACKVRDGKLSRDFVRVV